MTEILVASLVMALVLAADSWQVALIYVTVATRTVTLLQWSVVTVSMLVYYIYQQIRKAVVG